MGECSGPSSSFCDFLGYLGGWFYIHVTAVYNHAHLESVFNDSDQAGGNYTAIKEITKKELEISTVIQNNTSITVGLNQPLDDNGLLIVSNCLGQETNRILLPKGEKHIIINAPAAGFYFLSLKTNKEAVVRKIVVK
jgi:hypothetical protein